MWNTTNDYNAAIDNGTSTSYIQTGLINGTAYTLYVWAYNSCGNSTATILTQSTLAGYTISGIVTYDNTAGTVLSNIDIKLKNTEKNTIGQTSTDDTGQYRFDNIPNGTYTIEGTTSKSWRKATPTDALLINKSFVKLYNFKDDLLKRAADVNADNNANSTDGLLINKRFVKLIDVFKAGDWLFENNAINVSGANVVYNFKGVCTGDVSGSYTPSVKKACDFNIINDNEIIIKGREIIDLPIKLTRDLELGAMGLKLGIRNDELEIIDVKSNIEGLIFNIIDDEVNIAWTALNKGMNLAEGDTLFTLRMKANDKVNKHQGDLFLEAESVLSDFEANTLRGDLLSMPKLVYSNQQYDFSISCYPNPFKDETVISYVLPISGKVTILLTDILGRENETLVNAEQTAGRHKVIIDGKNKQAGIYFYTIKTKDVKVTKRLILVK